MQAYNSEVARTLKGTPNGGMSEERVCVVEEDLCELMPTTKIPGEKLFHNHKEGILSNHHTDVEGNTGNTIYYFNLFYSFCEVLAFF